MPVDTTYYPDICMKCVRMVLLELGFVNHIEFAIVNVNIGI